MLAYCTSFFNIRFIVSHFQKKSNTHREVQNAFLHFAQISAKTFVIFWLLFQ